MHEPIDQIIVNETGVFIPRAIFGHDAEIVEELRHAGVLAAANEISEHALETASRPVVREVAPLNLSRELQWLATHRHEYLGQWVALEGDRLLAHGTNAREVFQQARQAGVASPFIEQILPIDELPFGGW
jgi:hypothetical protein